MLHKMLKHGLSKQVFWQQSSVLPSFSSTLPVIILCEVGEDWKLLARTTGVDAKEGSLPKFRQTGQKPIISTTALGSKPIVDGSARQCVESLNQQLEAAAVFCGDVKLSALSHFHGHIARGPNRQGLSKPLFNVEPEM